SGGAGGGPARRVLVLLRRVRLQRIRVAHRDVLRDPQLPVAPRVVELVEERPALLGGGELPVHDDRARVDVPLGGPVARVGRPLDDRDLVAERELDLPRQPIDGALGRRRVRHRGAAPTRTGGVWAMPARILAPPRGVKSRGGELTRSARGRSPFTL